MPSPSDPKLIVADEPVSALDVSIQAQILNLMRDLQTRHGLTFMLISHDLAVVRYMADTLGVMYLGKLVEVGPATEIYARPAHHYTRGLLDAVPETDVATARSKVRKKGTAPGRIALADQSPVRMPLPHPVSGGPGCLFRSGAPDVGFRARTSRRLPLPAADTGRPGRRGCTICRFEVTQAPTALGDLRAGPGQRCWRRTSRESRRASPT